jgi:hypothetical protein
VLRSAEAPQLSAAGYRRLTRIRRYLGAAVSRSSRSADCPVHRPQGENVNFELLRLLGEPLKFLRILGTRGFHRQLSDPSTDLQVRCHGSERDGREVIEKSTQAVYLEAMVGGASGAHHRIFALSLKEVTRMKRSARTG